MPYAADKSAGRPKYSTYYASVNNQDDKLRRINAAITYYENNREHMKYDEYRVAGYPIGDGVAEGARRQLVKERMEGTGMRWTVAGAQAMLHLRAVYLNGRWDEFIEYHAETEQTRLYGKAAA
jgi:hypothetical protein